MNALMWEQWGQPLSGDTLLLVARSRSDLEKSEISNFVRSLDPVVEISTQAHGKTSGTYFYRWAYGYRGAPGSPPPVNAPEKAAHVP